MKRSWQMPLATAALIVVGRVSAEPLEAILARMDAASATFTGFKAKFQWIDYTAVLKEESRSEGEIRSKVGKTGTVMLLDFTGKDAHTVHSTGKIVEVFYPKPNQEMVYDLGKYKGSKSLVEEFFRLGFGTSAAQLKKDYDVKAGPVETVAGKPATRVDLTPRSVDVRMLFPKIELWFPEGANYPIQERVTKDSKDTITLLYSDQKVNIAISDADVALNLPPGVKKVYPQR